MKILFSEHGIQIHRYSDLGDGFEICLPKGNTDWELYVVPLYPDRIRFLGYYDDLYEAIKEAKSWT